MAGACLVTGFLGSGKTTFLKKLVDRYRDRKVVYLVNEFSSSDVDARIVSQTGAETVSVAGGSIFCTCMVGEFITQLTSILERFDLPESPLDGIIIEASGVADPRVISKMLKDTRLDTRISLQSVVSIVDPGSFAKLCQTLPAVHAQVQAADIVLVNKCDLHTPVKLAETEALIRNIQPRAAILRTEFGQAGLDVLGECFARELEGELAPCKDPNFQSYVITPADNLDLDALGQALETVKESVFRLKGYANSTQGWARIDYSMSGLNWEPADTPEKPGLVLIGNPDFAADLHGLAAAIRRGVFEGSSSGNTLWIS